MERAEGLLEGAIDIHIHVGPDIKERLLNGFEAANQAREVGMKAIVLKGHHINTTDRAEMISAAIEGIKVYGGITLNKSMGGFNPFAVEVAIKLGAKMIWFPTQSAASHLKSKGKPYQDGLTVFQGGLDSSGLIHPEIKEICKIIAESNVVLATGHISFQEIMALIEVAQDVGVKKIIINHPQNRCVGMGIKEQLAVSVKGVYLEQCFNFCTPHLPLLKPEDLYKAIKEVGPQKCVMATDMGQVDNFQPVEGLRVFIQMMLDRGITKNEIKTMVADNPSLLLGI